MARQARLRSSSRVRGLGPAWVARRTAGCERARHHKPKPSSVVQARIRLLNCQYHRVSLSTVVTICVVLAGVSTIRLGLFATCRVRAGRLVRSR
ncbi:hypothetical protein D3C84_1023030 [compost metagenome]